MNLTVKDDFGQGLNTDIWSTKRIEPGRWSFCQIEGRDAVKIELHKGDKQATDKRGVITERSELSENPETLISLGTNIWYAFLFYLPEDFPIVDNRLVIAQWKQYTPQPESPFFSFRYSGGELMAKVAVETEEHRVKFREKKEWRGKWHDVLVNYLLTEKQEGFAKAWIDKKEFANYQGKLGFTPNAPLTYFKMGLYRDQIDLPQTIYFSHFRRGIKREDCIR